MSAAYYAAIMLCRARYLEMCALYEGLDLGRGPVSFHDVTAFLAEFADSVPLLKLSRWLGYVQGVLIERGATTVARERDWSRPLCRPLDFADKGSAPAPLYSTAEIAQASAAGAEISSKIAEKVSKMNTWRSRVVDAALAAIIADGTPREWLFLEQDVGTEADEIRIMQALYPVLPTAPGERRPGVMRARVWIDNSKALTEYKITQHYEGPDLKEFTP